MIAPRLLPLAALVALACLAAPSVRADDAQPTELVHVPTDEMDVLLRADRQGIVLKYADYQTLLEAAAVRRALLEGQPPVDGTLVAAEGTIDLLTDAKAAGLDLRYRVTVLADGPRSVPFPLGGFALEDLVVQDLDGAASGRYEEWQGHPRLRFEEPGERVVTARGSAAYARKDETRYLDLRLPPASAMALTLRLPPGVECHVQGEGPVTVVRTPASSSQEVRARPSRAGRLRIAFQPAAKGADAGPPILDTRANALHDVGDGLVHSRVILQVDVFRTPVSQLTVEMPRDFALRSLTGQGVTGYVRDETTGRVRVDLEKPVLGSVVLTIEGERPYRPGPDVALPNLGLADAVRHRATMAVQFGRDVRVRGLEVAGGKRLPASREQGQEHLLRYELDRSDARLAVELEAGRVRLDAASTYYLNLAEAGKTLIATTTYRVTEGTVFGLRPQLPGGYELRTITINGREDGFSRDLRPDGTLELALARGVPEGGEIALAATFEQSQADWVKDGEPQAVPFRVPSAGAEREEGFVGIGADAAFRVLQTMTSDLVAVGAGDLTARGISATGLVYGYRLDGPKPVVNLSVQRYEPVLEAQVVTTLVPSAKRLDLVGTVMHRIRRAGVREVLVDVPAWADKDQVRFESPFVRTSARLEGAQRPTDVPTGYERWRVEFNQRVIGRHTTVVRYHRDGSDENWSVAPDVPLGVRVPLTGTERFLVVQRAEGLEVRIRTEGTRSIELADLPRGAAVDGLRALDVLRLPTEGEGVAVSVQRHEGAAVLAAVATQVILRTAVAREGILRTRAWVHLFNVDRQFLQVQLPPGSELIGAVVDGEPVKALADPQGVLMLPIRTARRRDDQTVASFTYETRLGAAIAGHVRVPGPLFPGLEVIQTEHRVAFDADVRIAAVGGAYGATRVPTSALRKPWLLGAFASLFQTEAAVVQREFSASQSTIDFNSLQQNPTFGDDGTWEVRWATGDPVFRDEEIADHAETDNDLPYEESFGESEGMSDAPFEGPASNGTIGLGGGAGGRFAARRLGLLERQLRQSKEKRGAGSEDDKRVVEELERAVARERTRLQAQARQLDHGEPKPEAPPPPSGPPTTPAPSPDTGGADGYDAETAQPLADPGAPAASSGPGRMRPGRGSRAADVHEGDVPGEIRRHGGRAALRKGLLSLDVPVVLGPRIVVARRLGHGGAIDLDLATDASDRTRLNLLWLAFVAVGALAGLRSRARKHLVVWGGLVLALLMRAILGDAGNTLTVAVADAITVLAFAWGAGWILARLRGRGAARAAAALLVGCVLLAGVSTNARADEPRPPVPTVQAPRKVFVPYDPADPTSVKPTDRVFLPLETYLKLYKAAHPESDPELVALGRMVLVLDAHYEVQVTGGTQGMAEGSARYRFAKRGRGTLLVHWPLGGLAITDAILDGQPVRLLLDKGQYRIAVTEPGEHELVLRYRVPVLGNADGRSFVFSVQPFARARLDVTAADFDGDVYVAGAGRVETSYERGGGTTTCRARAWLGRVDRVAVRLAETAPAELPTTVRTRAESRTIHSLRDEGTETQVDVTLFILQGKAPFLDLALPEGVTILDAAGPQIVRWEVLAQPQPRLRLTFQAPATGAVKVAVRAFRAAGSPERTEVLPDMPVLAATGESGVVVVNAEVSSRIDVLETRNLFRMGLPQGEVFLGADGRGRLTGAWRFASRPSSLQVRARRIEPRLDVETTAAVVFGDDRVRTGLRGRVTIDPRAPVGRLVFALPGTDEVLRVESPGLDTWWLAGTGDARRLFLRYLDLRQGDLDVTVQLERKLAGLRDAIAAPRWALQDARRDRGHLTLFAAPDVELRAGSVPGLRSLPLAGRTHPTTGVEGARPVNAYAWDTPPGESLPVGLRTPELEVEAVVVTVVAPDDEAHGVEQLVLFDVRRGSTDKLRIFVPDGVDDPEATGRDVVTTQDLREIRRERAVRRGPDGVEVTGTIYDLLLQSPREDVIAVTVSQQWAARSAGLLRPVRLVRPENVSTTHWFALVRTFLDGSVSVAPAAGRPDVAAWEDLPFVKAGLTPNVVVASYASRELYSLTVAAERHEIEDQSEATVQAAVATVVVGLDGQARVRMDYSVFNRARQFLRIRLPAGALLFGATSRGEPVKPLAGKEGTILLPVPKVPLGGRGYPVSLLYRARAGDDLARDGALQVLLPEILDVEVDRTVVRLYVPDAYDYDFESKMTPATHADVAADLAEVAVREARDLLKLAETGTLQQRQAAVGNGLFLIERARARLSEAPEAWLRYRGLASELNQIGKQLEERREVAVQDFDIAQQVEATQDLANEEYASNARKIVQVESESQEESSEAEQGVASKNRAGWVLNRSQAVGGKAPGKGKAQFEELRERLEGKLRGRAEVERRKNVATAGEQTKAQTAAVLVQGDLAKGMTLDSKQLAWFNGAIQLDQQRNLQLGAVDASRINDLSAYVEQRQQGPGQTDMGGQAVAGGGGGGEADRIGRIALDPSNYGFALQAGDGYASGFQAGQAGLPQLADAPSSGFGFSDGERGSWQARVENRYEAPAAQGKVGLMGVDVALPRTGQVYYFRSLKSGGPIAIEASRSATAPGARVALLLLILAAAAVLGRFIQVRRRAAA